MKTMMQRLAEDTDLSLPDEKDQIWLENFKRSLASVNSGKYVEPVLLSIPKTCCKTDKPFLKEHSDILPTFMAKQSSKYCQKLFIHLNDCYFCFEIYSEEMRRYSRLMEYVCKG
jgi:hypothetical protein